MIKDEFKFIGKNKLILLSVLVITLIPFLYCIFFLKSVWDPYGDTKNLPVAVVNLDQPVTYQGKKLDVGAQTLTKLKKNHQLGWHFVSEAEAKKGMKADKYYTVITLPKDFSKNAATVLDEHPKKMTLKYETNDSLNYIGQVISGIGVDSLNSEIRANVTNAYASAVFDQIKTIGNGMKTAAGAATQIDAGQVKLDDGIDQYTVAVSQVNDGVQTMKVKVAPMSSQIPKLASGANQVAGGLQTLNGSTTNLASGVNQLAAGSGQVTSGLGTLQSQTGTLKSGVGQLATGSSKVTNGLGTLQTKTGQLVAGTNQLQTGSKKLTEGINNYTQQVTFLSDGISQLAGQTSNLPKDTKSLQSGSTQLSQSLQKMGQTVNDQNQKAATELPALEESLAAYKSQLEAESKQNPELIAGFEKIQASVNALIDQTETSGTEMATTFNQGLIPYSTQLAAGVDKLNQQAPILTEKIGVLQNGSKQITARNDQLIIGANKLDNGINQAATLTPAMVSGVNQLYTGSSQVSGGLGSLNSQVPALTSGINQLYTGSSQVSGGLGTLNGQVPTLTNGVGQLTNGASQVAGGVNQLNASVPTLVSGVNQLADGTGQINDKSDTLKSGSSQLEDGDKKFAKTLTSSARKVNGITLTGDTAKMFAAPTKTAQKHYSYVPNYGHALAPYVLSLALYVGALVFNFAYPIRKVSRADGTATQWFLSKVAIGGAVALGTAVLEATLMMATGLKVDNIGLFYLTAILFSFTSMYLIMFLSMAFDNPGRFVAMVGLMLQLGGAGGTFPMEITNQFYNAIHPFLPMTYSIMNFRNALTGGIANSTVNLGFMVLIVFTIGSLMLLWGTMILLQRHHLMGISQLDDNQKLQAVEK
ncbi:MAG: YhgE/Pip domain-containing protein [Lacticaseibacillus paracasei]